MPCLCAFRLARSIPLRAIFVALEQLSDVTWYPAMAYAEWVDKRLPTEAEWEYAARGGLKGKKYPNGNTLTGRDANFNSDGVPLNPPGGNHGLRPIAVGKYPKNGYGLYDMAGNVSEWCLDEYDSEFYFTFPRNGVARNPLSGANNIDWILDNYTGSNAIRAERGGYFFAPLEQCRVTRRAGRQPGAAGGGTGFRCVKDVTD